MDTPANVSQIVNDHDFNFRVKLEKVTVFRNRFITASLCNGIFVRVPVYNRLNAVELYLDH